MIQPPQVGGFKLHQNLARNHAERRKATYAWMINQNHCIVPANIVIEENGLQDRLEVVWFGDRGWKAVQDLGAAVVRL